MKKTNVFGVILAGGIGSRMGNVEKPKQFMEIGKKPIIIHTIEKFVLNPQFERIIVLTPRQWVKHTQDMIRKFILQGDRIDVIQGGETRNETIMNSINHIENKYGLDDETIIVTHDSVRPFVTHRILEDNIRMAKKTGACDTVIPATDTIVESCDHKFITNIPDRSCMYQGQTPQSFKAKKLRDVYGALSEEEKAILTDACKIYVLKGEKVELVNGEVFNIKITYPNDLRVAESLLGGDASC
ncbi:MAG: 2-C-methyl-D-erythritol 4-phosphate cytidylyltransferase [Eubacteriales bacterium]|nr:2-C-methyl-D-erythritol 4-phosphate cytidylyltransferase [Eubacteriales bacterium]